MCHVNFIDFLQIIISVTKAKIKFKCHRIDDCDDDNNNHDDDDDDGGDGDGDK